MTLAAGAALEADVVVVGAGVAGALVAERLARRKVRVAMLEAGPRIDRAAAMRRFVQAPVKIPESPYPPTEEADHPVSDDADHWYRQHGPDKFKSTYIKAVGGTTWHWLGTCLRFLPADFELAGRYGHGIDWPIGYEVLEPYYLEAEHALGVSGDSAEDLGSPRSGDFPLPPIPATYQDKAFAAALAGTAYQVKATPQARNALAYGGRPPCCGSASCIPICPIGAKYDAATHVAAAERQGARLVAPATAVGIDTDAGGRVAGIRFLRPDLSEGFARARAYVLAAHAIETPRLLLHSASDRAPNGVANGSGAVGRHLMDHPIQLSWALAERPVWPYRGPISTAGIESQRDGAVRRRHASWRTQISNDGWNWPTGGLLVLGRDLAAQGLSGQALRQALHDHAARHVQLASLVEQLPAAANRIALDDEARDRYGVPLPRIHFDIGDYARQGLAAARAAHAEIFAKLGVTEAHHKDEFQGAGHIIGTCRMGEDAARSVVDAELRSHDHRNLYVVGSAVFPTSGTANPTLTIAALSLRLAAGLARRLG